MTPTETVNVAHATNDTTPVRTQSENALQRAVSASYGSEDIRGRSNIVASRTVLRVAGEHELDNLTLATLHGSGMISERPFVFADNDEGSIMAFYHLGRRLAGHAGLVHGGMIAVLLDECMGRACFPRLEGKIAVTAKMEIAYKSPMKVDSVIVIRAWTKDIQGRKAFVEAVVEDAAERRLIASATALFIQPKWASEMSACLP
ncbi:uncharacterized protein AB675_7798 [Cyphellophora attinorum]|uniref:Thioesterase domain-containing protein n=1 Tax=Cyphellophora attinorum TaxID=1664694 RepID=A0A0N1H4Z2_9EURO|nr:uncharacterized protein AB675_7798 [Phialophora attinorum]KPI40542.1 hypothetical protein AB675_7798 [Phialophora attinorum]